MAYQDISTPAKVMINELSKTRTFFQRVGSSFSNLFERLVQNSAAQRRLDMVQILQSKSDDELARMNIKREDIMRHVFRDMLYL